MAGYYAASLKRKVFKGIIKMYNNINIFIFFQLRKRNMSVLEVSYGQ